jgi:hypothetical protein
MTEKQKRAKKPTLSTVLSTDRSSHGMAWQGIVHYQVRKIDNGLFLNLLE